MIIVNGDVVKVNHFPDGTQLIKDVRHELRTNIKWFYENDEELVSLIYMVGHLRSNGVKEIYLSMPYIPNARQDRVKTRKDVFTLKYFAQIINFLQFDEVHVLDPHSAVSVALINNITVGSPEKYIQSAYERVKCYEGKRSRGVCVFYPDEGAMKRYSDMLHVPYAFGIKNRDWETGEITGLSVNGNTEIIKGNDALIVDDICSRGGTFYFAAKKLKELGANRVFLYVTHCENTIFEGELLTNDLIDHVYTTNSILNKEHERISVIGLW